MSRRRDVDTGEETGAGGFGPCPVVAILGPTAVGKTRLALRLAQTFNGEIVSADSRQVYRYLTIGTAKPSASEQRAVKHHLIDLVDPDVTYGLACFLRDARSALDSIRSTGRVAFLVGGTGYYARALLQGVSIPEVEPDPRNRARIESEVDGLDNAAVLGRIRERDPDSVHRLDRSNRRRLVRALEILETTGDPIPGLQARPIPAIVLGLSMERSGLYARADRRVDQQMLAGLVEETAGILKMGFSPSLPVLNGLAYRQMLDYLEGRRSLPEAIQSYKNATHALIRRQLTWFRKEPRIQWLDAEDDRLYEEAESRVVAYLDRR